MFQRTILICLFGMLSLSTDGFAAEGMVQMPVAKPKKTITVTGHEDFETEKGFGEKDKNVDMMNLMMVEGSGMEGMDMNEMTQPGKPPEKKDPQSAPKKTSN